MIYHESGYTNDIGERETKETTETKGKHKQVTLNFDQQSPNVDIRSYVLITDKLDADRGSSKQGGLERSGLRGANEGCGFIQQHISAGFHFPCGG